MPHSPIQWTPEQTLLEDLTQFAQQHGQTPEDIVTAAVQAYLQSETSADEDPLIGLFSGPDNLASDSENILNQSINPRSGWTWKQ